MTISSSAEPLHDVSGDWLVLGVWEDEPLPDPLAALDAHLGGVLERLKGRGDLGGKHKEVAPLLDVRGIRAERLLIVGLGIRGKATRETLAAAGGAAARSLTGRPFQRIVLALPEGKPNLDIEAIGVAFGTGFAHGCEGPGLRKTKPKRFEPWEICLLSQTAGDQLPAIAQRVDVESRAVSLTRELVNLPPCDKYPELLAARAQSVAQKAGLEVTVFDDKRLAEERMNSLLAVAQGSDRPARSSNGTASSRSAVRWPLSACGSIQVARCTTCGR